MKNATNGPAAQAAGPSTKGHPDLGGYSCPHGELGRPDCRPDKLCLPCANFGPPPTPESERFWRWVHKYGLLPRDYCPVGGPDHRHFPPTPECWEAGERALEAIRSRLGKARRDWVTSRELVDLAGPDIWIGWVKRELQRKVIGGHVAYRDPESNHPGGEYDSSVFPPRDLVTGRACTEWRVGELAQIGDESDSDWWARTAHTRASVREVVARHGPLSVRAIGEQLGEPTAPVVSLVARMLGEGSLVRVSGGLFGLVVTIPPLKEQSRPEACPECRRPLDSADRARHRVAPRASMGARP